MTIAPKIWTEVACRPRSVPRGFLRWSEIPDAGIRLADAQIMAAQGKLVMANRHEPDTVYLVVRPSSSTVDGA